jgi:DNA polymerase-1
MFEAVIKQAAASAPQSLGGKIDELLVDADGICYFCAGSATTTPGQALINVQEKLKAVEAVAGVKAVLCATHEDSPKGNRYFIASVKPYQGTRHSGGKPVNWAFLRKRMMAGDFGRTLEVETYGEADDLCASRAGPRTALHYQDKDFRMMPGWHITWKNYSLIYVPEDCWSLEHDGLVYGEKWFWLQMIQGDPADNIPGIEAPAGKKFGPGPKTAEKWLDGLDRADAIARVVAGYEERYGDDARARLLEQAQLLWMRKQPLDDRDCVNRGPLRGMGYASTDEG